MLRFRPIYEARPWGGRNLNETFERSIPEGPIGESWELVELPEHESVIARGEMEGRKLGDLWRSGELGGSAEGPFPFLLKWLDSQEQLSVQVHPDERACEVLGKGVPKTEAWYVAHVAPDSRILMGHYPGLDGPTLKQAAESTIAKWMYETRPRVGDMLYVPAGTLHAVGAGFLLLEVQQPSDTTYRVHDWGRVGLDGQPRELHLDEACASVNFDATSAPRPTRKPITGPSFHMQVLRTGARLAAAALRVLVAQDGPMQVATNNGTESIAYGDVVVAQPSDGDITISEGTALLLTEPPPPGSQQPDPANS